MNNIPKILEAFSALAKALPSSPHITLGLHDSDTMFRVLVDMGAKAHHAVGDETEWDWATLHIDGASISAYTARRPIVRVDADPARVEFALAQAEEALQ